MTDIQNDMASTDKNLRFSADAAVSKKFDENVCPTGFVSNPEYASCSGKPQSERWRVSFKFLCLSTTNGWVQRKLNSNCIRLNERSKAN